MRIPRGVWAIVKEVARHLLRRPVVGVAAAARTSDGRWLLIRRSDTGEWALPGGTLEWGENLRDALIRELDEEAGVRTLEIGQLVGVYSAAHRDERFHAVTVVVSVTVSEPQHPPDNPAEILEVRLFEQNQVPATLAHSMSDMLTHAIEGRQYWE